MTHETSRSTARQDFLRARRQGELRHLWNLLRGRNDSLIPFEDLKKTMGFEGQRYRGLRPVPLEKIIGSLGRSEDFDRAFLPTQTHSRGKWVSVDSAWLSGVTLPPVSLYKVGDAYFVVDGHHRVSVARRQGQSFIDAEVIEVQSRVPVTADLDLGDLDRVVAYREFLEQTKLDQLRPDADLRLTMPGDYARMVDHIHVHQYFAGQEDNTPLTWEQAVCHWYDEVYSPVIETIQRQKLLADFPGHTDADLYLWIIDHAYYLSQEYGQSVDPWEVAKYYVDRFSHRPRRLWRRIRRRIMQILVPDSLESGPPAGTWREERVENSPEGALFRDILVTVTGAETGWLALSQAAEIARIEQSTIRGMHVARSSSKEAMAHGRSVLDEFTFRCESLGVPCSTNLATGNVADEIVDRARWVDLIVINQRREHGRWAERPLGTIFQMVASQTARPILAVPGTEVTPLRRIVLAYDGSPKANEALFVFRHAIQYWGAHGTIVTVASANTDQAMLEAAWEYAQQGGGGAVTTRYESGNPADVLTRVMGEDNADLLLLGGFGYQPLLKAFLGSTVDRILRVAWFPVLICR